MASLFHALSRVLRYLINFGQEYASSADGSKPPVSKAKLTYTLVVKIQCRALKIFYFEK